MRRLPKLPLGLKLTIFGLFVLESPAVIGAGLTAVGRPRLPPEVTLLIAALGAVLVIAGLVLTLRAVRRR